MKKVIFLFILAFSLTAQANAFCWFQEEIQTEYDGNLFTKCCNSKYSCVNEFDECIYEGKDLPNTI